MGAVRGIGMEWSMTRTSYGRDTREMGSPSLKSESEAGVGVLRKRGGTMILGMIEGAEVEGVMVDVRGVGEVEIVMMIETEIGGEEEMINIGHEGEDRLFKKSRSCVYQH